MLPRLRRPALALLTAPALFANCYSYIPSPQPPPPGTRVEAELTDMGTVEMARYVGPGAGAIEGRLLGATDSVLTLGVIAVRQRNGVESYWSGESVPVPRALVSAVGARRLSRTRTALAVSVATAAVAGAAMLFAGRGVGGGRGPGGGGVAR